MEGGEKNMNETKKKDERTNKQTSKRKNREERGTKALTFTAAIGAIRPGINLAIRKRFAPISRERERGRGWLDIIVFML